jgi:hydrogenase maturation protein HypF
MAAYSIHLKGIVQGVGFRPYVFRLAQEMNIYGWIVNSSQGVDIHAEGAGVDLFFERLMQELPPLAKLTAAERHEAEFQNYPSFEIRQSKDEGAHEVLISPDVATCPDCLEDMKDAQNRRFQYPFTNCTNCGPRYTIIQDVPYDRTQTTMKGFPMCPDCAREYGDPLDRRFHAQPVACTKCGPAVQLSNAQGEVFPGLGIEQLAQGAILAVKGLGGFQLVCDARNPQAVRRLRKRKERGAKPFAVMARNLEAIEDQLGVSALEKNQLLSPAAPIVILERRIDARNPLPEEIAPGLHTMGVMLPYTPLHSLLLNSSLDFLVMTSANLSGRPLIYDNAEAIRGLQGIADYFLVHNRDIFHPCDDSVLQIIGEEVVFHRRARGYVPLPQNNPSEVAKAILGVGGELKNAFCLALGQRAFVSQYIGDMEGYENFLRFHQELASFQDVVQIKPEVVAHDAHPNYQTTRFALASDWPQIKVQHHHAHLVSVLGEHTRTSPTLGVICDGTGWGDDQKIWGFEFLKGNAGHYERLAHLEHLPLPGGDAGAKSPLRIAYAYARSLLSEGQLRKSERLWERLSLAERKLLDQQLAKKIQVFETSSAGRLFDAVSALLDICTEVTYEGQAAIELESRASLWHRQNEGNLIAIAPISPIVPLTPMNQGELSDSLPHYPIGLEVMGKTIVLRVNRLFHGIIEDCLEGRDSGWIAYQFHDSIAAAIVGTVRELQGAEEPIVLSGGVFQNKLLTERVLAYCTQLKIQVLRARELPPGDGGLSFGQVLIANEVYKACV